MELKLTFNSVEDYKKARTSLDSMCIPSYPAYGLSEEKMQGRKPILIVVGKSTTLKFVLTYILDGKNIPMEYSIEK